MSRTILTRLDELCNVDVDDADYHFIEKLPLKPHNQTSNQRVISLVLNAPHNHDLLVETIRKHGHEGWETVLARMSVRICANNLHLLSGRVLIQTSPRHLNDKAAILKQCYAYDQYFKEAGVPRNRFCIKIPFSGAGAAASAELNSVGIRTLATTVFCLEQAIAASQAKCLFISPYFNEMAARFDPSLRPNVQDTALEHPMSFRIIHILELLTKLYQKTGEEQPVMVIAAHFNPKEVMAMAELGCQHVTVSKPNLTEMMKTPDQLPPITQAKPTHPYALLTTPSRLSSLSAADPLAGKAWNGVLASTDVDYLADEGRALDNAIDNDAVARKRITDAMNFFMDWEKECERIITEEAAKI